MKKPCVYILTNKRKGTLYIGMTAYHSRRLDQHMTSEARSFVTKYKLDQLVYIEFHETVEDAARREKQMKEWKRHWKLALIESINPEWQDLKHLLI